MLFAVMAAGACVCVCVCMCVCVCVFSCESPLKGGELVLFVSMLCAYGMMCMHEQGRAPESSSEICNLVDRC